MITEKKLEQWLEQPLYPYDDDNTKDMLKYLASVVLTVVFCYPLFIYIHELGHATTGVLFGWRIEEFVVNYDSGVVRFVFNEVLQTQLLPSFMIGIAGVVFTSFVIYMPSIIFSHMRTIIWLFLPYGLWEGLKDILITYRMPVIMRLADGGFYSYQVPTDMYWSYVELATPIETIGFAIFVALVVYQGLNILFKKPLGSME